MPEDNTPPSIYSRIMQQMIRKALKFKVENLLLWLYNHIIIYRAKSIDINNTLKDEPKRDKLDNLDAGEW